MNVRLYFWQRLTAAIMAPLVFVHLCLILYAGGKGLTAAEILARTRGSLAWALFYGLFVAAAAVHASIGLRNVLAEWTRIDVRWLDPVAVTAGALLALLGMRAVYAVVLS